MRRKRWVIKAGSQLICSGGPILLRSWMQQIFTLRRDYEIEVAWVTSGAIASAVERTDFKKHHHDRTLFEKQALSAIGQPLIMDMYNLALQATGQLGAQVLLTYDDLSSKHRLVNFKHTMEQLLKWSTVPIINENDAVATEEIKFGDNDTLSAKVACAVKAQRLVILTDVGGLFHEDPKKNPNAKPISVLPRVTREALNCAGGAGSHMGLGGMWSKLQAAKKATRCGIQTWLVKGDEPGVLLQVANNQLVGTCIGK